MEGSLHQSQETGGAPGSETLQPSVCSVCQGLFDKDHRRAYVLERAPHERFGTDDEEYESKRYVYTYVHHADLRSLLVSVEAGCRICTNISRAIWQWTTEDREKIDAARQAQKSAGLIAGPRAAQPDVDLPAATELAEVGKRERLLDIKELYYRGKDRILIRIYFDFESQGRFYGHIEAKVHYLNDHKGRYKRTVGEPISGLRHFYTPCMFKHSQKIPLTISGSSRTDDTIDPDLEHRPSKDLLSGPHIALIDRWRQVCERQHESCRKFSQHQPMPRRVLEIMDPSNIKKGVRLVENQDETRGVYACLSYCWGESQAGQAKSSNILSYLDGIPLDDLPNTVVDAIRLCHQLGIRYLWVDRLCIKQDDEKDWSEQASRMCEIYSRSALTISVPVCKDSSQSFLGIRRLGFRERDKFITITHDDPTGKSMSWIDGRNFFNRANGPWFLEKSWKGFDSSSNYSQNRWLERGWTFQEWMLSPRVLHIDSITLWDCFDGYANELFRRDVEEPCLSRNPADLGNRISWDFIVREYSARQITHEKDRLPALAGLAIQYSTATGSTYLAGLWREGLLRSLLWMRSIGSDDFEYAWRVNKYAPSWSWASLNDGIDYDISPQGKEFTEKASVLSTFCQYNPPNSCSTVEKAWIDINGHVGIVTAMSHGKIARRANSIIEGMRWDINLDYDITFLDDAIHQKSIFVLLLGSNVRFAGGLLIQQCDDEDGHQCYRRLGIAWYTYSPQDGASPDIGLEWETRTVRLI